MLLYLYNSSEQIDDIYAMKRPMLLYLYNSSEQIHEVAAIHC